MKFDPPLQAATLLRRYKRFLADIRLPSGDEITIHCPNTGSMRNCLAEGQPCWYSTSDNPKRKYAHSWELATTPDGDLACIHSARANAVALAAIERGTIAELQGYSKLRTEVRYGQENSRIDIYLEREGELPCLVEVKCVTLREDSAEQVNRGLFPDSVSARGSKHLRELIAMREQGHRCVLLFCALNNGIFSVAPADSIDPEYGQLLRKAYACGVEILAYGSLSGEVVSAAGVVLQDRLPVHLD